MDHAEFGVQAPQIQRVARDHRTPGRPCAHNDVRIRDVGSPGLRQQQADGLSVGSIERNHLGLVVLHQAPQPHLRCRISNYLGENGGGNYDPVSVLQRRIEEDDNSPVITFQRDQTTCIERDAAQAALRGLAALVRRFCGASILRAHARSFAVTGPPVAARDSSIMARNSTEFSSDLCTAC